MEDQEVISIWISWTKTKMRREEFQFFSWGPKEAKPRILVDLVAESSSIRINHFSIRRPKL